MFPRIFLKRAFLIYNTFKSNTWDRIIFRKEQIHEEGYYHEEKNPFLELEIDVYRFDEDIRQKFKLWIDPTWKQDQYCLLYNKPGYIEPHTGWGLSLSKSLVYPSLGFASASHVHKPSVLATYLKKKKLTHLSRIISLRDTGEENYFHFFNDVLPKLFFLVDRNIDIKEYSIVISHNLFNKPYFQFFLEHTYISQLNWKVQQPLEWIIFNEAVFCKPFTHTKRYYTKSVELLNFLPKVDGNKRIFLTRSRESLRYIENIEALYPSLIKLNFEIVDTSLLSFSEQITLFYQCRFLVAIHGAGIANIIFRLGKPLALLEIVHPSPYIPFHYISLSKLYNYEYDVILGNKGKEWGRGGFVVDPKEFETKLMNLINS